MAGVLREARRARVRVQELHRYVRATILLSDAPALLYRPSGGSGLRRRKPGKF